MATAMSGPTSPRFKPVMLSARDLAIVRAIATYRFMTADDVAQLLFRPTSLTYVREVLRRLCGGGDYVARHFLYRFPVPSSTRGTKVRAYALGVKGREVLLEEGYYRPYKLRYLSYGHIWHALTLTRVMCAAHAWCRRKESCFRVAKVSLAYELSRTLPLVPMETEGQTTHVAVVPDAFVCFERADGKKFQVLLEIDRGTEFQKAFKQRVRGRIELVRSDMYLRVFQIPAVVVAYATIGALPMDEDRQTRRATMERWTREVVSELIPEEDRQEWLGIFRFCTLPADIYTNMNRLFVETFWRRPDSETPVPLLIV